jgi:serine/threonine protein kinase
VHDCPATGATLDDRWSLGELLGRGAMAAVYAAVDTETGDRAAVKMLRVDGDDDAVRFAREVGVLRSLDHPAVVRLLDHGVADSCPYLVLERVDGGSLDRLLATGVLAPDRVASIGSTLAGGLAAAHGLGIVHRDVKPSNILLTRAGVTKLADFGLARSSSAAEISGIRGVVGTAAYMAPEQARDPMRVDFRSDIYSLGVTAYHALTAGLPFADHEARQHAGGRAVRPNRFAAIPTPLDDLILAMLSPSPADRPGCYGAIDAALRAVR